MSDPMGVSHSGKVHLERRGESVGYDLGHRHLTPNNVQFLAKAERHMEYRDTKYGVGDATPFGNVGIPPPLLRGNWPPPASHVIKGSSPKGPIGFSAKPDSALHLEGFLFPTRESRRHTRHAASTTMHAEGRHRRLLIAGKRSSVRGCSVGMGSPLAIP